MRDYELVAILNPEISDDAAPQAIERLSQQVAGRGGEVVDTAHWGRRKLAYPINRYYEGNYVVMQVRMEPNRTHDLENNLRITEDVLRHLLVLKGE